jgi:hypothetical protein
MQAGVGETVKPGEFQFAQICDIFVGVLLRRLSRSRSSSDFAGKSAFWRSPSAPDVRFRLTFGLPTRRTAVRETAHSPAPVPPQEFEIAASRQKSSSMSGTLDVRKPQNPRWSECRSDTTFGRIQEFCRETGRPSCCTSSTSCLRPSHQLLTSQNPEMAVATIDIWVNPRLKKVDSSANDQAPI